MYSANHANISFVSDNKLYVVRPEDTLESIAAYFNITPQQLLYSNYGIDPLIYTWIKFYAYL